MSQELQFKVLSAALDLAKILGAHHFTHEYCQTLRESLEARSNDILNSTDTDRLAIYSYGDGGIPIHHALDILAGIPSDTRAGETLVKGFVNKIFTTRTLYFYSAPQVSQYPHQSQELPENPYDWYQSLQELGSWSFSAICLMRYSRITPRDPEHQEMNRVAFSVVSDLTRKFKPMLSNQFQKLIERPTTTNNAKRVVRQQLRRVNFEVPMDHFHGILSLLYLVDNLATECGHLAYFYELEAFCTRAIGLCLDMPSFEMLRFKMFEVLLSIKYSRTNDASLDDSDLPRLRGFDALRSQLRFEAELAKTRFLKKKELQENAQISAVRHMDDFRGQLAPPSLAEYGFFGPSNLGNAAPDFPRSPSRQKEYKLPPLPRSVQNTGSSLPLKRRPIDEEIQ
ncbi:MAG: hypothetical protein M1814_000974 [Vezdaea aestivalis]|nr:MAG: hypothetical protein M1814_000974 [Vezdaea aestivalis]